MAFVVSTEKVIFLFVKTTLIPESFPLINSAV